MYRCASVATALLLVAGCGGGRDDAEVEQAANAFAGALRADDPAAGCAILAPLTREELESSQKQSCADALASQDLLRPANFRSVDRFGREAQVVVEDEAGQTDTWFLSRFDSGWLIVAAGCEPRRGQLPHDCQVEGP